MSKKLTSILLLVLTIGFYNCGSDGTNQVPWEATGAFDGLFLESSTPGHQQFYVDGSTTMITLRMSEQLNINSIPGNVRLFNISNGGEQDVTPSNIVGTGQIITINNVSLAENQDYEVRLYPALAAASGNTLLQGQSFQYFFVDFSTGNGGTQGQSVAGAPSVTNVSRSNGFSCFGAMIQFNESLAYQPQVTIEYKDLFFQWHTIPVWAMPAQMNNNTQWRVDLPQGYCNDIITGSNIKVHVIDYVDLSGEHGAQHDSQFTYWL